MDIDKLFEIKGKSALVTGGSGGIGFMIAEALLRAGANVVICSRKQTQIEAAAEQLSKRGRITPIAADLSTEAGISALAGTLNAAGPLNILVNNAGATWGAPIDAFPRSGFEKILNLNLLAPFELTKALLPALRRGASQDDPARIINIASVDAFRVPHWENYPYSASKAGLVHLTRHLGKFLAKDNINVNAIAPGLFRSKMSGSALDFEDPAAMADVASPIGARIGTIEDIGGAVIYLTSRAGAWLSGVTIPVAGGFGTIE